MVAGVALVAGSSGASAAPARPQTWKLAKVTGLAGNDSLGDLVVTGKRSAWAVGSYQTLDGAYGPLVERWNGTGWTRTTIPDLPNTGLGPVDASSDKNVWAFGTDLSNFELKALRWDGKTWKSSTVDEDVALYDADVVAPNDVWLAGDGFAQEAGLKHWNGRTWKSIAVPGQLFDLEVASAKQGWAVGMANRQPLAMRWNGTRWTSVPTPRYTAPSNGEVSLSSIVSLSPKDAWAVGTITWQVEDGEEHRPIAQHWNGTKWSKVKVPDYKFGLGGLAADGRGGLWMKAGDWSALIHLQSAKWTKVPQPSPPSSTTLMEQMANVPGTSTMLGVGTVNTWGAPENNNSDAAFFSAR